MRRYLEYGTGGVWFDCRVVHLPYIRRASDLTVDRCRSSHYNGTRLPSNIDYIWPVARYLFTSAFTGGASTAAGWFVTGLYVPSVAGMPVASGVEVVVIERRCREGHWQ